MKEFSLIFLALFSLSADAQDALPGEELETCTSTPVSVSLSGTAHFQRDSPVGTESEYITPDIQQSVTCALISDKDGITDRDAYYQFSASGESESGMPGVFKTNVEGVGIRFYYDVKEFYGFTYCRRENSEEYIRTNGSYIGLICHWLDDTPSERVTSLIRAKLVKTSPSITSGTVTSTPAMINTQMVYNWTAFTYPLDGITISSSINVLSDKCTVSNNNMSFDIGNVSITDFDGQSGYAPAKTSVQNLNLSCDNNANINITLTGNQNPDCSEQSVLALSNQGQPGIAQGVGVQLLYNNIPIKLNEMLNLKHSSGGQEIFPIEARYYQTKDKDQIRPGKANATATLNLTYQ
ncbi:fimbrial protein [Enterobacter asburiae]|uniref:fimbrial protein n=1 Tax=Enterobacter asburiae TaxID=61645 RepID=UPI0009C12F76|nr:fimbrial protein [Enterobacter asburiae]MBT2098074.1 fimbrial protein [Enterobacter asburiae]